ncbi:unnamed protein product, partial [marine sediment metagenome]
TAIIIAIAGWVWLFTINRRRAWLTVIIWLLVGIPVFIIINIISRGGFYYQMIVLNIFYGRSEQGLMFRLVSFFFRRWAIFILAAFVGLFTLIRRRENSIWAYFFVFSLLNIIVTNRHGAVLNYFIPIVAALSIICGREACYLDKKIIKSNHPLAGRIGLLIIALVGLILVNLWQYRRPKKVDLELMNSYRNYIQNLKGDVLLSQMHSLAFLGNKKVFIFPMHFKSHFNYNYEDVDQTLILTDISKQRFTNILD